MAILVGAIAVLGELVRQGVFSASEARDLSEAQLLCESKLAEIAAGIAPASAVQNVPCELDPNWLYSIELLPVDRVGVIQLRVTVGQYEAGGRPPVAFSLVRWIQDPAVTGTGQSAEETSSTDSGQTGSSSGSSR